MAIKGCSRQMIVLNGTGSSMFETAYFIVKTDSDMPLRTHGDMLREANRIVDENTFPVCSGRRPLSNSRFKMILFFAGVLCGAALTGFIWLIIAVIRMIGS